MAVDAPLDRRPGFADVLGRRGVSVGLLLSGLVLASVVVRALLARRIVAPWIMGDELIYSEMAKSFAATGHFRFREGPVGWYSIYPAFIAPAWWAHSLATTYAIAKTINALLLSLTAVPVFFWVRRMASGVVAFIAAALVLLMPTLVYSTTLMTENLFVPVFVTAAFVIALALERPTPWRQLIALAVVALAIAVRLQAIIFVGILPLAVLLKVLLDVRAEPPARLGSAVGRSLLRFWPAAAGAAAAIVLYVGYREAEGTSVTQTGGYGNVVTSLGDYSWRSVARWTSFHFADLVLASGVIPLAAFILLVLLSLRRASGFGPAERSFVAVALAATPLVVVQAAAFASRFSLRIEERNFFCVVPLLIVALAVWLARGAPRPVGATVAAVVIPVALLASLPLESLFGVSLVSDTFGLIPLYRLSQDLAGGATDVRALLPLGAIAAGIVFAAVPRRAVIVVVPIVLAGYFVLATGAVLAMTRQQSIGARSAPGQSDVSWIDHTVGTSRNVVYVNSFGLTQNPHILWQTEFWNRSVGPVLNLGPGHPMAGDTALLDPVTGRFIVYDPAVREQVDHAKYVVLDSSLKPAGDEISHAAQLQLYDLWRGLQLATSQQGIDPDGWMGADAATNVFATKSGKRGTVRVTLSRVPLGTAAPPTRVFVAAGPIVEAHGQPSIGKRYVSRTVTVGPKHPLTVTLRAPRPPYRVQIHVDNTFDASQLGQGDTRRLGAMVTVTPSG